MSYTFCLKSKLKQITLKTKPGTCILHRAWLQGMVKSVTGLHDSSTEDAQILQSRKRTA